MIYKKLVEKVKFIIFWLTANFVIIYVANNKWYYFMRRFMTHVETINRMS